MRLCGSHKILEIFSASDNFRWNKSNHTIWETRIEAENTAVSNISSNRYAHRSVRPHTALSQSLFIIKSGICLDDAVSSCNISCLNQSIFATDIKFGRISRSML